MSKKECIGDLKVEILVINVVKALWDHSDPDKFKKAGQWHKKDDSLNQNHEAYNVITMDASISIKTTFYTSTDTVKTALNFWDHGLGL